MKTQKEAPPATINEFAQYLRTWSANIERWKNHPDGVHENECRDCATLLYEAQVQGYRFGICELPTQRFVNFPHEEAIAALTRLLDACEHREIQDLPPDAELTVAQVAKRLNVAESTIYDLVQNKEIPHKRYGTGRGTIRIRLCDLLDYSKQQTVSVKPGAITLAQLLKA